MMLVGSLSAIYSETASHTRLRRPVSPLARLWGVLPADCRATRSSPERRQRPHHQMCARAMKMRFILSSEGCP